MSELDPAVARMKERLLTAPYEICMARALHFTRSYRETEGMDPHLRNALALRRTLQNQGIAIRPDERLAGSKTERFLAGPLSVERGDFLRTLQLELDILHLKRRPFRISEADRRSFLEEVLPYWDGRTVRDRKAAHWEADGLIDTGSRPWEIPRKAVRTARWARYVGRHAGARMLGARLKGPRTIAGLRHLGPLRFEWARNNPTPATYCFDVQGHLCLGVDKVVSRGMQAIIAQIRDRMSSLRGPAIASERAFLEAALLSLEAAIAYSERFAGLAEKLAAEVDDPEERARLDAIARHCRHVPRHPPRTFHEALQSAYFTLLVGEIQYGTQDVFAVGRADQYLFPFYQRDRAEGRLTEERAVALLQEFYLKQTANIDPIPEAGMESNAVLGNSQHVVTIGGLTPEGTDATNALTLLMLDAFVQMNGCANQLSVRLSERSPAELWERTARTFRTTSGIALFNDEAVVTALQADGMAVEDARDYCIVGCVETSGQSDTHGCPGGHELVLPAVLLLTLSRGRRPPRAPGQKRGFDSGDPATFDTWPALLEAFRHQLAYQIDVLVRAAAGKDRAHRELLPAPYVSALMDDCIDRARDITAGGARYDFTSLDVRGLATVVDSLLALRTFVYERRACSLPEMLRILDRDFAGHEVLRQRLIREAPKYGTRDPDADALARDVVHWIHRILAPRRNARGGRWRACYYSYGNHVIDGLMLGATPDGRRRGTPISNGVSPNNFVALPAGPLGPMAAVASLPPEEASSGVSLNLRFHPDFLRTDDGLRSFSALIRTYFAMGGMHVQPNVVSTETLRDAQRHPERHRDLVVKVSGYSAYFTDLGCSIQEDIIARHEFGG